MVPSLQCQLSSLDGPFHGLHRQQGVNLVLCVAQEVRRRIGIAVHHLEEEVSAGNTMIGMLHHVRGIQEVQAHLQGVGGRTLDLHQEHHREDALLQTEVVHLAEDEGQRVIQALAAIVGAEVGADHPVAVVLVGEDKRSDHTPVYPSTWHAFGVAIIPILELP